MGLWVCRCVGVGFCFVVVTSCQPPLGGHDISKKYRTLILCFGSEVFFLGVSELPYKSTSDNRDTMTWVRNRRGSSREST